MNAAEIYVTVVILAALGLILSEWVRADVVALMVLIALAVAQVITPQDAISGFSRSAVITLIGLFIITAALDRTGVTQVIADRLFKVGGGSEARLIFLFMVGAAGLSLFMNNIAAGAVLLPSAVNVSRRTKIPASKLLMPMAFGTLLGGMATFFTTANILVSTALKDRNLPALGILDFTPTGGVVMVAGIAYMMLIGRRLLPNRTPAGQQMVLQRSSAELEKAYQLQDRLWETTVPPTSPLAGQTLADSGIGARLGVTVVAIWHRGHANLTPTPNDVIHANDILLVAGREDRVSQLTEQGLKMGRNGVHNSLTGNGGGPKVMLVEAIVAPRSQAEGHTLKELNFRKKFGLTTVALWRDGRSYRTDVGTFPLRFGDALLMVGPPDRISLLRSEPDFIVLQGESETILNPRRAMLAFTITVAVLAVATVGALSIPIAMLLGAVLMVLTGSLTMDESYRAIDWKAIFLVAGMLPISIAMNQTGLAQHLGDTLLSILGPAGPLAVIGGLYLLTVAVGQVMGGQVTALVLAPIAISAATQMHTSPQAAGLAVAIGCSTSFLTPVAHPVNILMMGPGGYTFGDFFKVGWGLVVVCFIALLIALPIFWKL